MLRLSRAIWRSFASTSSSTAGEQRLTEILKKTIPGIKSLEVEDVSNGCGSMYSIFVESSAFKGMPKVAQHKMITGALQEEIKDMHGLSINTKVAK